MQQDWGNLVFRFQLPIEKALSTGERRRHGTTLRDVTEALDRHGAPPTWYQGHSPRQAPSRRHPETALDQDCQDGRDRARPQGRPCGTGAPRIRRDRHSIDKQIQRSLDWTRTMCLTQSRSFCARGIYTISPAHGIVSPLDRIRILKLCGSAFIVLPDDLRNRSRHTEGWPGGPALGRTSDGRSRNIAVMKKLAATP
jgi:hypothetical protein